jgi:hypothetical protein
MNPLKFLPVILFLFASAAYSFSLSSLIKQAEVIKANAVISANATAIKVSTTIKGFAANDPFFIKNIDVPKTSFMTHVKGNISSLTKRNAWYAAWFATMAAAGWAIDELTNQMTARYKNGLGYCYVSTNYIGTFTPADCAPKTYTHPDYEFVSFQLTSAQSDVGVVGKTSYYVSSFKNKTNGNFVTPSFRVAWQTSLDEIKPVPDDALYDSLVSHMLQDPQSAAQAFMVPDAWPYPYPQIFPEQVPYIPGVADSDQEALDWYYKGLLQSTNPNAPYYVSPERYQQIATLANQLQQGTTPEGQANEQNNNLKNPLTQAQLEETLKKRDIEQKKEAEEMSKTNTKPISDAYKDSKLKEEYDKLRERVTDPSKLPQLPPLPAQAQIDLPTHKQCQTITMNFFNGVLTFPNPDQCQKLEQVKTGLGYLMYVLTALGLIMELLRRVE